MSAGEADCGSTVAHSSRPRNLDEPYSKMVLRAARARPAACERVSARRSGRLGRALQWLAEGHVQGGRANWPCGLSPSTSFCVMGELALFSSLA